MIRRAIVPAYLVVCLLLGGASAAGFAANLLLQLAGIALLAIALIVPMRDPLPRAARSLLALLALLALLLALQLVPLPPSLWSALPGRAPVAEGLRLLGITPGWMALSLNPAATIASALWLLPAAAVLVAMLQLRAFAPGVVAWAVVGVTAISVALGALQVIGGAGSAWYLYAITNTGQAVGFFANSNHAATLLVVTIPFLSALQLAGLRRSRSPRRASALLVITSAGLMVVLVGLVTNASLAGLGLAVPVTLASFLLIPEGTRRQRIGLATAALTTLAGVALILLAPTGNNLTEQTGDADLDQLSRRTSISQTLSAAVEYLPFGSGTGTFQAVYRTREDPAAVTTTFMNHAHSDVSEVLLEMGLPGAVLMLLLLAWWGARAVALWREAEADPFARAAVIATGAMLAHSLVDYPLRTAGLSALFAACLALMTQVRPYTSEGSRRDRS